MKKLLSVLVVLLLAMAPVIAQRTGTLTPTTPANAAIQISGSNAQITEALLNKSAQAVQNGVLNLSLAAGTYDLLLKAAGSKDLNVSLVISQANNQVRVQVLQGRASLFDQSVAVGSKDPIAVRLTFEANLVSLTVNSNIKGASVALNNGQSFAAGSAISLAPGQYTATVSAPGYNAVTTTINLTANQAVTVNLSPLTYNLTVVANVKGATITINNNRAGTDSVTQSLPAGTYNIRVSAAGFTDFATSVNLGSDQTVSANLVPVTYTLSINSNVKGSTIFLGGNQIGNDSVTTQVQAGTYEVRVSAPGYTDFVTTANVSRNTSINASLQLMMGTVVFDFPKGTSAIKVIIDGKQLNSAANSATLTPGTHTIRYEVLSLFAEVTINVVAGQTTTLTPVLTIQVK